MFQIRSSNQCKGPVVEAYLVCSRYSKKASVAGTEGAVVRTEDRKRDRGNSCTVAYKAQNTLSRSGNYRRIWGSGAIQSDFYLTKDHSGCYL